MLPRSIELINFIFNVIIFYNNEAGSFIPGRKSPSSTASGENRKVARLEVRAINFPMVFSASIYM
jgi:hypothetical protein